MKLREAIAKADELRPNKVDDEIKADWIERLDHKIAEFMEKEPPDHTFPQDRELLMPYPYDDVYMLYSAAMIDYYQCDGDLYTNDLMVFNTAMKDAQAWWRRNHRPSAGYNRRR